jgi:hypothetical protein
MSTSSFARTGRDWDRLRAGARLFSVRGVPVTVADAAEIWSLRARFKDSGDV